MPCVWRNYNSPGTPLSGDCSTGQTTINGPKWPDAWIPNYNVNWDAKSCYYSVQDYCPGVPAADVTYTTSYFNFFPDELAGNKIGNSSMVLPAAGQYFIIYTPLWRFYGQGQWHTFGDNLGSEASPLAVTNGKTPTLGCTHTGTGVASTWGPPLG
jgi:hypothetical protein